MIEIPNCLISWKTFYDVHEKDSKLQANLRKAPKLTYRAIQPSNNKQSMPLALTIFDESTTGAIECYFPEKPDAACFLSAFQKLFVIYNVEHITILSICLEMQLFVMIKMDIMDRTMVKLPKLFIYKTNIARSHNYTKSYVLFTIRVT